MKDGPNKGGPGIMILGAVAMIACCAVPLLLAGGALTGFGAWLSGGDMTWLVVAAIAVAGGYVLWRRRAGDARTGSAADRIGQAGRGLPK